MLPIYIVDYVSPYAYDLETLRSGSIGGTEGTVIRIAEKLGEKAPVIVFQHKREILVKSSHVTYSPIDLDHLHKPCQAILVLRDPEVAIRLRFFFKTTPIWVWLHDLVNIYFLKNMKLLADLDIGCIGVSDFHIRQLRELCRLDPDLGIPPKLKRIYNPIDDDLVRNDTEVDLDKLVFVSSFPKGLEHTIKGFEYVQRFNHSFVLWVTRPGTESQEIKKIYHRKVKYLNALTHADNIQHVRSALCVFYLNHVYPETFGLALAEANAVGTPVLTHRLGAAPEVLSDEQLINTHDLEAVAKRLMEWRKGLRPKVFGNDQFRLSQIVKQWEELLFSHSLS